MFRQNKKQDNYNRGASTSNHKLCNNVQALKAAATDKVHVASQKRPPSKSDDVPFELERLI